MKPKKIFLHIIVPFLIAVFVIIDLNRQAVFQRGNPLPYLSAAAKIDDEKPFFHVRNSDSKTYISNLSSPDEEFIEFAENKLDSRFISQEGSIYVFSSDGKTVYVESEIYMGKYKVWDFPNV